MPWPNGFASRCKFATCVQVASRLATLLSRFVFNSDDLRLIWRSSNSFSTRCKFFTVLPPNAIYAWNLPILPFLWENWALMDRIEVSFPWNCKKLLNFFQTLFPQYFYIVYGRAPVFAVVAWTSEPTCEWVLAFHCKSVRKLKTCVDMCRLASAFCFRIFLVVILI